MSINPPVCMCECLYVRVSKCVCMSELNAVLLLHACIYMAREKVSVCRISVMSLAGIMCARESYCVHSVIRWDRTGGFYPSLSLSLSYIRRGWVKISLLPI